ncbi:hypothetical protein [Paenibacillus sp. FSL K6-2859]|uniref:hypothetical protein n=1 Tax=Paenibacillus sp. FSL K6-2859 TaxID=2921482 RepID=UPI0030FAC043
MVGQRQRSFVEEKMIKKMDAWGDCDDLDVKAAVMKRVRAIHDQQKIINGEMTHFRDELDSFSMPGNPVMQKQEKILPHPSRFRKRLLSGVSAAALLGMIGFGALQLSGLGDLAEHGSQSTIDITQPSDGAITLVSSGGKAIVQTVHNNTPVPTTSTAIEKYLSLLETYKEQVLAYLNVGEMAAYYVNDPEFTKLVKGLGYGNQLQYAFKSPMYTKYQNFANELKGTGDFWPELPSKLTNGYEFEQATFKAASPYGSINTEHKEMLEQFQKKAKADDTGQKLFMEKITVNAIESAEVTYHKGDQRITLSLSQSELLGNGAQQVSILEGQTAEKWSLTNTGKEAAFIAASTQQGAQAWYSLNRLYWYDEASQTIRSLNDGLNNSLTREQWQVIANSFIR